MVFGGALSLGALSLEAHLLNDTSNPGENSSVLQKVSSSSTIHCNIRNL